MFKSELSKEHVQFVTGIYTDLQNYGAGRNERVPAMLVALLRAAFFLACFKNLFKTCF